MPWLAPGCSSTPRRGYNLAGDGLKGLIVSLGVVAQEFFEEFALWHCVQSRIDSEIQSNR